MQRKKLALNIPVKGHLFTVWESKQEVRVSPWSTTAGNKHMGRLKIFLLHSADACNDLKQAASIDFDGTNKF